MSEPPAKIAEEKTTLCILFYVTFILKYLNNRNTVVYKNIAPPPHGRAHRWVTSGNCSIVESSLHSGFEGRSHCTSSLGGWEVRVVSAEGDCFFSYFLVVWENVSPAPAPLRFLFFVTFHKGLFFHGKSSSSSHVKDTTPCMSVRLPPGFESGTVLRGYGATATCRAGAQMMVGCEGCTLLLQLRSSSRSLRWASQHNYLGYSFFTRATFHRHIIMLILNIYHPVTPLYAVAESTKQKQNKKLYGLLMKSLT